MHAIQKMSPQLSSHALSCSYTALVNCFPPLMVLQIQIRLHLSTKTCHQMQANLTIQLFTTFSILLQDNHHLPPACISKKYHSNVYSSLDHTNLNSPTYIRCCSCITICPFHYLSCPFAP